MFSAYGKSLAAAAVLVVTAVQAALSDSVTGGRITEVEMVQVAIAFAAALTVYLVPAVPEWPWVKTAVAALYSALQVLVVLIVDGVSTADWTALILAGLTVLTVGASPAHTEQLDRRIPAGDAFS